MKKVLLYLLLLLCVVFPVNAQSYKSNAMGQKLGPSEEGDEYVLNEENNIGTLFHNNEQIKTFSTFMDGKNMVVRETNLKNNSTVEKTYRDGFLINKKINSASQNIEYTFNYNNSSLVFCTIKEGESEPVTEYYIKDSVNGKLIGTKKFSDINLSGSKYLIENDTMFSQISDSFVVENEFTINDEGNISYKKGNNTYTYTTSGQILNSSEDGIITSYTYSDDGHLIQSETVSGQEKTVNYYEDDKLTKGMVFEKDNLKSIIDYTNEEFGRIMTVYNNNKAIADVFYGTDNIKIMKIEYLD